jgi:hypothetical protein
MFFIIYTWLVAPETKNLHLLLIYFHIFKLMPLESVVFLHSRKENQVDILNIILIIKDFYLAEI